MRALAWDDVPKHYMNDVKLYLSDWGIDLTITEKEEEFARRWNTEGPWDFVITDLVKAPPLPGGKSDPLVGARISASINGAVPVFLVTEQIELLKSETLGLPGGVVIKSKSTLPVWFAKDIVENLKQKGVYVKRSRVFVIYGSDRLNPGLRSDVVGWLSRHGIQADIIDPTTLKDQLLTGLIDRMQEAAAFVAICTPDDAVFEDGSSRKPSYFQPRQNVLLEIGMVLGLPRGVNRLIALQAWGNTVEDQARFPSDLSGLLTLRVENGQVDWDGFQKSLLLRGVALQP